MPNQIVLLAPERLHTIIERESREGRRADLAEALLRLLHLHTSYIARPGSASPEERERQPRLGSILPHAEQAGEHILLEFGWSIIQDPRPNGHGGTTGEPVLNGGLIQHADHTWRIHT